MSPVFLTMFQNEMVEAGEGVLAVEDMSGESMELLLKHIYTGSVDKLDDLKVDVVLELLNASNKVKSSRIYGTSPFEWIRSSSINLFFALVMTCTVRPSPAEGILRDDPRPILHCSKCSGHS
jgi:hypothetical protein